MKIITVDRFHGHASDKRSARDGLPNRREGSQFARHRATTKPWVILLSVGKIVIPSQSEGLSLEDLLLRGPNRLHPDDTRAHQSVTSPALSSVDIPTPPPALVVHQAAGTGVSFAVPSAMVNATRPSPRSQPKNPCVAILSHRVVKVPSESTGTSRHVECQN